MNEQMKQQIADALGVYCNRFDSQNKAANSLSGVSSATVSQALKGNWELISAEMWRRIASQVGFSTVNWMLAPTSVSKRITALLLDAQGVNTGESNVHAVIGPAGCGKTETAKKYAAEHKNVYHLSCSEYWNRKTFLEELTTTMGYEPNGLTNNELVKNVVGKLKTQECPLIILDEADKMSDQVFYFFITLYNQLEDRCGIVMLSTDFMSKRMMRGLRNNRKGYNEIYSRMGRRFVDIEGNTFDDMAAICEANGVADKKQVEKIINNSESDLRRVKKLTKAAIKKAKLTA